MAVLAFRLFGPLAAWGTGEAGETDRPSAGHPGRSAVFGLLAAALGLRREDEAAQAGLAGSYRLAVAASGARRVLRNYRTVQTVEPDRRQRKAGFVSRKHALETGAGVHTMITRRDYLQDGLWRVFLAPRRAPAYSPDDLAAALRRPVFELYLGRRDCPLALPPDPACLDDAPLRELLTAYPPVPEDPAPQRRRPFARLSDRLHRWPVVLAWEPDFPGAPDSATPGLARRQVADEPLSSLHRRFAHREERALHLPSAAAARGDGGAA